MQPETAIKDRFKTAAVVSNRITRIQRELQQLEVALDGSYQSLIDSLQQSVTNLQLFTQVAVIA